MAKYTANVNVEMVFELDPANMTKAQLIAALEDKAKEALNQDEISISDVENSNGDMIVVSAEQDMFDMILDRTANNLYLTEKQLKDMCRALKALEESGIIKPQIIASKLISVGIPEAFIRKNLGYSDIVMGAARRISENKATLADLVYDERLNEENEIEKQ